MKPREIIASLIEIANTYDSENKREVANDIDAAIQRVAQLVENGELDARQNALARMNEIAANPQPSLDEVREYRQLAASLNTHSSGQEQFQQRLTEGGASVAVDPTP